MYWQIVLEEVKNKHLPEQAFCFTNLGEYRQEKLEHLPEKRKKGYTPADHKKYYIKDSGAVYFTRREAECMYFLLENKSLYEISLLLNLSQRTIEYYVKNMKIKFDCHSKAQLISKVLHSNFYEVIDFNLT